MAFTTHKIAFDVLVNNYFSKLTTYSHFFLQMTNYADICIDIPPTFEIVPQMNRITFVVARAFKFRKTHKTIN